tara:strand:+ start:781 stop:1176 length:396 start_codon:yes stop_codon:yes gene_type:complete
MVDKVSVDTLTDLKLGTFYHLTGELPKPNMPIPPQVFRLESFTNTAFGGTLSLIGTLWMKVFVAGRWYSTKQNPFCILAHHINMKSQGTGKHGLRLERIEQEKVSSILGKGRAYDDIVKSAPPREALRKEP